MTPLAPDRLIPLRSHMHWCQPATVLVALLLLPAELSAADRSDGPLLEVIPHSANILVAEGGMNRRIGTVYRGQRIWSRENREGFYRVEAPGTGREGWIEGQHARQVVLSDTESAEIEATLRSVRQLERQG